LHVRTTLISLILFARIEQELNYLRATSTVAVDSLLGLLSHPMQAALSAPAIAWQFHVPLIVSLNKTIIKQALCD